MLAKVYFSFVCKLNEPKTFPLEKFIDFAIHHSTVTNFSFALRNHYLFSVLKDSTELESAKRIFRNKKMKIFVRSEEKLFFIIFQLF